MKNRTYDAGKFIAQIALPAAGGLYFALAQIWHLPKGEEVVGTITAVDAFLGVLLGLSTQAYNKSPRSNDGVLAVAHTKEGDKFAFNMRNHPGDVIDEGKDKFIFKVEHVDPDEVGLGEVPPVDLPEADHG